MSRALICCLFLVACGSPDSSAPAGECLGNVCAGASDCAMGTRCNQELSPPRCQVLYCGAEDTACDDDLLCVQGTRCLSGFCASGAKQGQPCGLEVSCVAGLVCARTAGSCNSTCQTLAPLPAAFGAECGSDDECQSQRCTKTNNCLGTCDTPPQPYPAGPYGFTKGAVVANLRLQGKSSPSGSASYSSLPLRSIELADYYNDPSVKYLVLLGEVAWSSPCKDQQSLVQGWVASYAAKGVRILDVLVENELESPAGESDLDAWGDDYLAHADVAIDPMGGLHEFDSEVGGFPLSIIIQTSTMKVQYSALGDVDLTSYLDGL